MRNAALLVTVMILMCGPALAGQSEPSLPSVAPIQAGPVALYPRLVVRDIGIDSNIFNESTGPRDDFTFTVNPRLQAALGMGAARFIGTSSADFVYYRTHRDQQSTNGEFEARLETVSTKLRPFGSAGWLQTSNRTGHEIDARAARVRNSLLAGTDFEVTPITALTVWARRDRQTYASGEQFLGVDLGEQLDHTSGLVAAGAKFAVTPITTLTVALEVQRDRFDASPERDADSVRVGPSLQFGADTEITGRVSAGYRDFNPRDPRLPRYRGFVVAADASYTLLGVTRFEVQANRDVVYSFAPTHPYYLGSGGSLTVSQRIAGPFDVIGLGSRQRLRYQDLSGASLDGGIETTRTLGGGIGIRVGQHLRVTITYDRTERSSSEATDRDYTRSRVLSAVSYGL